VADFLASFIEPPANLFVTVDPTDFLAVIMPLTAVVDVAPPVGTPITITSVPVAKHDPIVIQVDDVTLVKYVIANIKFPDGTWEVAYDGFEFSPRYRTYSTKTVNTGLRQTISLRREGGWPYSPTVSIRAVDGSGNVS
jgi:hypothetical protein